jgi:hypothetical protein
MLAQFHQFIYRKLNSVDPKHEIVTFGRNTGTGNLRKHLANVHIEDWVTACDRLHIPITAQGVEEAVKDFRKDPTIKTQAERAQYSKEAFVDAIVEFIVGDDQV